MKTIYFIRHGQSEANASLRIQQHGGTLLTPTGEVQAARAAEHLAKFPIDAIVSSTFARARATAEAIGDETGVIVEQSDLFIERRRPGVQLRMPKNHPSWLWTQLQLSVFSRFSWYKHSDEETPSELLMRARVALAYLASRPDEHIVVVTHGRFMRALHAIITFGDGITGRAYLGATRGMMIHNTALMLATYDEGRNEWKQLAWNIAAEDLSADLLD